jgi:dTDP-4-amino-4,6-dideoxygalactose transaminase
MSKNTPSDRINVTKTYLPPLEEYQEYLKDIWQRDWLTNQGPLLQDLENRLETTLQVSDLHLVTNGTLALQVSLRALGITEGEVVTTPFSYVATTSSILWERCTPVFVDIDPETYCIDPAKIEAAITKNTKAIMPVHVFGHPCDVEKIDVIAKKHNLKVIYDGAHAFGVTYKGKSLFSYGDITMGSFHATKLFHTIEGGCIVVNGGKDLNARVELIKHFGQIGDDHFMLGTNAKASEFQAAMGLCVLRHLDEIIAGRKRVTVLYDKLLDDKFSKSVPKEHEEPNYVYYPILLKNEAQLLEVVKSLNAQNIFPRRYFYPSLNTLPYLKERMVSCPISEDISLRILCLPIYPDLEEENIVKIAGIINGV